MLNGFAGKRVLVISPHTDDAEWGCGGTIARLVEIGAKVTNFVLSTAGDTLPKGFTAEDRCTESENAAKLLGIGRRGPYSMQNRKFHEYRQDILDLLCWEVGRNPPHLVIGPALTDTHQDHQVVAQEMVRAFKTHCSILGYEIPWNNLTFSPSCLVRLERSHVEAKLKALDCYESCKQAWHFQLSGAVKSLARTRGLQMKAKYAESFEVIRWVVR